MRVRRIQCQFCDVTEMVVQGERSRRLSLCKVTDKKASV